MQNLEELSYSRFQNVDYLCADQSVNCGIILFLTKVNVTKHCLAGMSRDIPEKAVI